MRARLGLVVLCLAWGCSGRATPGQSTGGAVETGGVSSTGGLLATGGVVATGGVPATDGGNSAHTGGSTTTGGAAGSRTSSISPTDPIATGYPGDRGIEADPRVLFHSDFENGLSGWTRYTSNAEQLAVLADATLAHAGSKYLRAQVTRTMLAADQYISANAQLDLPRRVPEVYWRFYARFVGTTATPHHWVRMAAGNPGFQSDGLANTLPAGDQGFWFDLDAHSDGFFNFYVYWYRMRSGRCNDGSATPGCAGDQGTTYYYGNNFSPAGQKAFARDAWLCVELRAKANTVGASDGELGLWVDDALVGEYKPGSPRGRWLRDNFFTWGQYYQDVQAFEGFDFRSSDDVLLKRVTLDAYYERGTLAASAPEAQVILYDDVVVATARIGCRTN